MSWLRLRQVALVAHRLEPVVEDLRAVLGIEIAHRDPAVKTFGLENAVLPVGDQFLEVVAPVQEATAAGRYLERRKGDGGYMVILQCGDHGPVKERVRRLGVRSALEQDTDTYRLLQLHPRDTGGSFLEIDEQVGAGPEPGGPWMPAGAGWQRAQRTEVVTGIATAEIQSPDPDRLAARWSEILERPVVAQGHMRVIRLDGAELRFVAEGDDRGEGLSAIDVVAVDRARALAAAEERGLRRGDDLEICGTRIRLVAPT